MSGKNDKSRFSLAALQEAAPAVNPVESMRRQLAMAAFGGIGEADVQAMITKLKEMAMGGDLKAMNMLLKFTTTLGDKSAPPPPPASDAGGLKMLAESLQNLVDEVRIAQADKKKAEKDPRRLVGSRNGKPDPDDDD